MKDALPAPLPDELHDLLDSERTAPVPPGVRERVLARLEASVAEQDAVRLVRSAAPTRAPGPGVSVAVEPPEPVALPWRQRRAVAGKGAGAVAMAAAAALLLGLAGRWLVVGNAPEPELLSLPAIAAEPADVVAELVMESPPRAAASRPPPLRSMLDDPAGLQRGDSDDGRAAPDPFGEPAGDTASAGSAQASAPAPDLETERILVDRARNALAQGRLEAALRAVGEHKRRFAAGVLAEDRAALEVRVLAQAGYPDRARAAAQAFVARYPASIHRAAVLRFVEGP